MTIVTESQELLLSGHCHGGTAPPPPTLQRCEERAKEKDLEMAGLRSFGNLKACSTRLLRDLAKRARSRGDLSRADLASLRPRLRRDKSEKMTSFSEQSVACL